MSIKFLPTHEAGGIVLNLTRRQFGNLTKQPGFPEKVTGKGWIQVSFTDGSSVEHDGNMLDAPLSKDLFSRNGRIDRIQVGAPAERLSKF